MRNRLRKWMPVGILLVAFGTLALSSARQKSATWDETHYLGLGNYLLAHLRWDVPSALLHPPLPYYLAALPLMLSELHMGCFEKGNPNDIGSGVRRGQCLLEKSRPSGDDLLFLSRISSVLLGLLLGWVVYLWSSRLYGRGGGLLSLFLYCLCPNLLAHSRLITPDIALTAFGTLTLFFLWQGWQKPSLRNDLLCGLFLGLTLLSKYSGLIWMPMALLLLVRGGALRRSMHFEGPAVSAGQGVRGGLILFSTALLLVFLAYGFEVHYFVEGLLTQAKIIGAGFPAFLAGQTSKQGGWWTYYLLATAFKVPLPLLLLLAIAFAAWVRSSTSHRSHGLFLLLPVATLMVVFSANDRVNVGIRYVLPAFPLLMVLAGALSQLWKTKRRLWVLIVAPLLIWYGYEGLSIHPHYLAYFNQLAGGPQNGYRRLVDSNLDWGQDLKGLRAYMEKKGIDTIKLSYFGTARPEQYGIRHEALPSFVLLNPRAPCREVRKGDLLAVSATNLYPLYVDLGPLARALQQLSPVDHIGYSILIYRMDRDVRLDAG